MLLLSIHQKPVVPHEKHRGFCPSQHPDYAEIRHCKLLSFLFSRRLISVENPNIINPNLSDVLLSKKFGSKCVEIHTGQISNKIKRKKNFSKELLKIKKCVILAFNIGLEVHAGHGMDYKTAKILSKINYIKEFNIGHFIIGESIFNGFKHTIKKFLRIIK